MFQLFLKKKREPKFKIIPVYKKERSFFFSKERKKEEGKRIEFPIFFSLLGYQPRLVLVRIGNHIIWPFKKYWQYVGTVLVITLVFTSGFFFYKYHSTIAATYYFIQSSWEGGADTEDFPAHPDNQTNWTKYYEKDDAIEAGAEVKLQQLPGEWEQKTGTDFDEGEFASTTVKGEGEEAVITLD